MKHPETYKLTRTEWLAINRALCGASLEMNRVRGTSASDRKNRVGEAIDILQTSYQNAEKEGS